VFSHLLDLKFKEDCLQFFLWELILLAGNFGFLDFSIAFWINRKNPARLICRSKPGDNRLPAYKCFIYIPLPKRANRRSMRSCCIGKGRLKGQSRKRKLSSEDRPGIRPSRCL
jgi:hypothetical protein